MLLPTVFYRFPKITGGMLEEESLNYLREWNKKNEESIYAESQNIYTIAFLLSYIEKIFYVCSDDMCSMYKLNRTVKATTLNKDLIEELNEMHERFHFWLINFNFDCCIKRWKNNEYKSLLDKKIKKYEKARDIMQGVLQGYSLKAESCETEETEERARTDKSNITERVEESEITEGVKTESKELLTYVKDTFVLSSFLAINNAELQDDKLISYTVGDAEENVLPTIFHLYDVMSPLPNNTSCENIFALTDTYHLLLSESFLNGLSDEFLSYLKIERVSSKRYIHKEKVDAEGNNLYLTVEEVVRTVLSLYPFETYISSVNLDSLVYDTHTKKFKSLPNFMLNVAVATEVNKFLNPYFFEIYTDEILNTAIQRHPVYSKLRLVTGEPFTLYNLRKFQPDISYEVVSPLFSSLITGCLTALFYPFSLPLTPLLFFFPIENMLHHKYNFTFDGAKLKDKYKFLNVFCSSTEKALKSRIKQLPLSLREALEKSFQLTFQLPRYMKVSELLESNYSDLFLLFLYTRSALKRNTLVNTCTKFFAHIDGEIIKPTDVDSAIMLELLNRLNFNEQSQLEEMKRSAFYNFWVTYSKNSSNLKEAESKLLKVCTYFLMSKIREDGYFVGPMQMLYTRTNIRLLVDDLITPSTFEFSDVWEECEDYNTALSSLEHEGVAQLEDSLKLISVREETSEKEICDEDVQHQSIEEVVISKLKVQIKDFLKQGEGVLPYEKIIELESILRDIEEENEVYIESNTSYPFEPYDMTSIRYYIQNTLLENSNILSHVSQQKKLQQVLIELIYTFPYLYTVLNMYFEMYAYYIESSECEVVGLTDTVKSQFVKSFAERICKAPTVESRLLLMIGIEKSYYAYTDAVGLEVSNYLLDLA